MTRPLQSNRRALAALGLGPFIVFALAASFIASVPAEAKPTLKQAVLALDGKYLKEWAPDPVDDTVKITAGGDKQPHVTQEIGQQSVIAKLTYGPAPDTNRDSGPMPIVTVYEDGKPVATVKNDETGSQYEFIVQLAEIDPSNDTPELVFSYFTGGAHCCGEVEVVDKVGGKWKTIDVGMFDGGALSAVDLDGDGRYEFEMADDAFHYAFGCYACSIAPLKILTIENGKVTNVSAEKQFRQAQAGWMKDIVGAARNDDPNAYLAGYVAEKILLGEGKAAWNLMLRYYDPKNDWGLKICPKPIDQNGNCPVAEKTFTYPQALAYTLKENGYQVPD